MIFYVQIPETIIRLLPSGDYEFKDFNRLKPYRNYRDALGRPLIMPVVLDNVLFEAVRININLRKHIVKTPVSGRSGTVKELIGTEDYQITLQGKLYNNEGNYPEEQVEILKGLFDKNEALKIGNPLTDILEIDSVIIESLEFPTSDKTDVQPFSLRLVSENEFEAILEE